MQRRGENGEIPFGALVSAKTQIDLRRAKGSNRIPDDAGIWNWEWLGPGNIGGRIRAILIHPTNTNTMWIGGVAGGIWKTDDAGSSWAPINDFMANLAVTSLIMDPTNSNLMYASTGEGFGNADGLQGAGIFRSIDGGNTWSQIPSTNNADFQWVNRIAHHPSLTNRFIAVTSTGVRRTTDGGANWSVVLADGNGTDVKYNPSNGNMVMVGTRFDLYLSTDGGTTWTTETNDAAGKLPGLGVRCEVAFTAANSSYLYTLMNRNQGEIWRSTDGGAVWEKRSTNGVLWVQGWYANAIAVSPVDANFVVAGGLDLWRSTDGGATLTRISSWNCYANCAGVQSAHADQHAIVFHPGFDGSANKKVLVGNDGGIQLAPDITTVGGASGQGWVNLANNLGITQFYSGAASPDGRVVIGGTQDNGLPQRNPLSQSNTWDYYPLGDGGATAIDYTNSRTRYSEYVYLDIVKSTDDGDNYFEAHNGISDVCTDPTVACTSALFIAPFSMDPNDPDILVAGGKSIWRTTDGAQHWTSVRGALSGGALCSAIDIAKGNSSTIWVGYTNGRVSFTTDTGGSWTDVDLNSPGLPARYVTDITINPGFPGDVFVSFGGYETDNIWMTTNYGTTWHSRQGSGAESVPALQVNTVKYHPLFQNWVYVGTDLGVFASEDNGIHWNTMPRFGQNDGPANVEVDELFWQGDEYLLAATHGRGMFRCNPLDMVFVDVNYVGLEDGSALRPYNTIQEGVDASGIATNMLINQGTYNEGHPVVFSKRIRVRATNGTVLVK